MVNTTDQYWSVDGVSLHTLAQNIESLAGRQLPPPMRGEDILIPYRVGEIFVPKTAGSRILTLGMWIRGNDANGAIPAGGTQNTFDDNWRTLRNLLWQPGRQFALQKRFRVGGIMKTATALGQFAGGLEPTMIGRNGAKFTVQIKLNDPYFYDDSYTSFTLVTGDNTVVLPGDQETTDIIITLAGARVNPIIRNKSILPNMQVQFYGSLVSGDTATINVKSFTALSDPAALPEFSANGMIRHTGAPQWLSLKGGSNVVNLTSDSGAGVTTLQAKGAWL